MAKLSEAKKCIRRFWMEMRKKDVLFTGRQLEKEVIKFFNLNLEVFPPGFGPFSMIEDAFKSKVLVKRRNKYIVV